MRWARRLAAVFLCGNALLAQTSAASPFDSADVGGIEPIQIDGRQYFFGFDFSADRVLTPLFPDAQAVATYATTHLRQRDGRKDQAFWVAQAHDALDYPQLTDRAGSMLDLRDFRRDLGELRRDSKTRRRLAGLDAPDHLLYLLETNCVWPEEGPPARVIASAKRLGLDLDDTSGWLESTTSFLSGDVAIPGRATFGDAASVYLWYLDTLLVHQRHDWSKELRLTP